MAQIEKEYIFHDAEFTLEWQKLNDHDIVEHKSQEETNGELDAEDIAQLNEVSVHRLDANEESGEDEDVDRSLGLAGQHDVGFESLEVVDAFECLGVLLAAQFYHFPLDVGDRDFILDVGVLELRSPLLVPWHDVHLFGRREQVHHDLLGVLGVIDQLELVVQFDGAWVGLVECPVVVELEEVAVQSIEADVFLHLRTDDSGNKHFECVTHLSDGDLCDAVVLGGVPGESGVSPLLPVYDAQSYYVFFLVHCDHSPQT